MSQLQVNRINDASGGVLAPISSVMRNRIINGAMVIDQRNAGASVSISAGGGFTLDRWAAYAAGTGVFSVQQSTTAPVGFTNSCLLTVTTADASVSGTDYYLLRQPIEGYNFADLNFGSANAKTVTISFWVRSSITGTFGGCLRNSGANYNYPFQYVINAADTWEQKSVTIAGAPAGTWLTTNGIGADLWFSIGTGSDYTDTVNVWNTKTGVVSANSSTNLISTSGATFYITGVQLEVGTQATSFEYRQYGTELALCQRYFFKVSGGSAPNATWGAAKITSSTNAGVHAVHPVAMRDLPTWSYGGSIVVEGTSGFAISAIAVTYSSLIATRLGLTISGATAGQGAFTTVGSTSSDFIQASAEL